MALQNCSECLTKLRSTYPDNRMIWETRRVCKQCFTKLNSQRTGGASPVVASVPDAAVKVPIGNG